MGWDLRGFRKTQTLRWKISPDCEYTVMALSSDGYPSGRDIGQIAHASHARESASSDSERRVGVGSGGRTHF